MSINEHVKISILTPVYNGMPFLKECVESVLKQTFKEWEMLISDNCSTDETRIFLDSLNDPRIKIYKQNTNLGIFGNLNFLFLKSTTAICQILCSDDYFISENSVDSIIKYWQLVSNEIGIARFNYSTNSSESVSKIQVKYTPKVISAGKASIWFFIFGNVCGNLSNLTLRTCLVEKYNWFNSELPYAGDFDFWHRVTNFVDIEFNNNCITYVRRHEKVASNYLNTKGELVAQKLQIVNIIYSQLLNKYSQISFFLKLHGTLNYDTLDRDIGVKNLIFRSKNEYIKKVDKASKMSNYTFNQPFLWLIFLLSLGGRFGRSLSARIIINIVKIKYPKNY